PERDGLGRVGIGSHARGAIDGVEHLLHVAIAVAGGEVARVVAAEGLAPVAAATGMAGGEDLRAGGQVGAGFAGFFVGVQVVLVEVGAIHLRHAQRVVVALGVEHVHGGQRFGQVPRLARQLAADHADRVRVGTRFDLDDVAHDLGRYGKVGASHQSDCGEHVVASCIRASVAWRGSGLQKTAARIEIDAGDATAPRVRLDVHDDVDGHLEQALDGGEFQPGAFGGSLHHQGELV